MNCLCCGKKLTNPNSSWHSKCIEKFFGTKKVPMINFSDLNKSINELGNELILNKKSIPGVQRKLSLHLSKEEDITRLTLIGYPQGYILKPNSEEYMYIAEAEHLVMSLANECKILTAPHALIKIGEKYAYITKRIDRIESKKIHMEDFCQLALLPTEYKYNGSYERCAKIIDKFSNNPTFDKVEFFYRLCFCYITGNSDMHLKNFSLIENNSKYHLSEAYDLLPVKMIINDIEDLALTLNGKKKNITKNDFLNFAINIGVDRKIAIKLITYLVNKKERFIEMINESYLPNKVKERFVNYVTSRIEKLN